MTIYREPFVFGGNVSGEGYIGRHQIYEKLMREVFLNMERSGSFAIHGLTRMGKTSLLRKCLRKEKEIRDNYVFPCWISVITIDDFRQFLYELVYRIKESYSESDVLSIDIIGKMDSFLEIVNKAIIPELKIQLEEIFTSIGQTGAKTVVILDEFDSVSKAFEGKVSYFQIFRNLISTEAYNTSFLMTCRLPIKAIEVALPQGSNLRGVINEIKLVGFNNDEIGDYFNLIEDCGLKLTDTQKKDVLYYGGNSPFILSGIAKELLSIDGGRGGVDRISISDVYKNIRDDVFAYFDSLIVHLKREKMYKHMLQVFLGPKHNLSDQDIDSLISYGYIYRNFKGAEGFIDPLTGDQYTYTTLSIHFVSYLRNSARDNDDDVIWRELIKTEKKLRALIKKCLENEYAPENWEVGLKKVAASKERGELFNVKLSEKFIEQNINDFGPSAVDDILSVISIKSLAKIIAAYWQEDFKDIFDPPNEQKCLEEKLAKLHRARNPLAHGSSECLSDDDRYEVNILCNEINRSIDSHVLSST